MDRSDDVTQLLSRARDGAPGARDALLDVVYGELRALAARRLRGERDDHTLGATALVHEAFLRLVDLTEVEWADRAHFYAVASRAMRRVLVDWARARVCQKRGGEGQPVSLDVLADAGVEPAGDVRPEAIVDLDEALDRLAAFDARKARVVECRYFAGLSIEETAAALDVSQTTVKTDWALAKAWLHRELADGARP